MSEKAREGKKRGDKKREDQIGEKESGEGEEYSGLEHVARGEDVGLIANDAIVVERRNALTEIQVDHHKQTVLSRH